VSFLQLRFGVEVATNIVADDQGVELIEMFAFGLSTMNWYGDRQADDTTLRDARIRAAAVAIARQLGYKPNAAVPPAVRITMTLAAPAPSRFTIERGRKLQGPGGLLFEVVDETVFDVGESGPKVFDAREGQALEAIFTSNGDPNQVHFITNIPTGFSIAQDTPQLFVSGIEWDEKRFLEFTQTDQFEFQYGFSPPRMVLGDGIAGNIPLSDAELRLQFFATNGAGGAVSANTVTAFVEPVVAGVTTLDVTLVHNDPSTPGSDRETIAAIKVNAPQVFQTAQRAVTQADLDAWINSFSDPTFGAVAIGRATTPRSAAQDAEAQTILQEMRDAGVAQDTIDRLEAYWNSVLASNCQAQIIVAQILAADAVGRYVTAPSGLASALESFLNAKAESTAKVHVSDGSINLLSVDLTVGVKVETPFASREQTEVVITNVRSALEDVLLARSYGASLRISDLYQLVDALTGVDYSHIAVTGNAEAVTRLNSFGDLVIEGFEVITLGLIPVVTPITT
ncbi:MAG TPA: hypothetical protein VFH61_06105, partial [Thermoleophilia bacterium]|nr:hypothetical protein [Thermoleophilia bacterium]